MDITTYIVLMICLTLLNVMMVCGSRIKNSLFEELPWLKGTKRLKVLILIFELLRFLDLIIFTILYFSLRNYIDRRYMTVFGWAGSVFANIFLWIIIYKIVLRFERRKEAERRNNLNRQS